MRKAKWYLAFAIAFSIIFVPNQVISAKSTVSASLQSGANDLIAASCWSHYSCRNIDLNNFAEICLNN